MSDSWPWLCPGVVDPTKLPGVSGLCKQSPFTTSKLKKTSRSDLPRMLLCWMGDLMAPNRAGRYGLGSLSMYLPTEQAHHLIVESPQESRIGVLSIVGYVAKPIVGEANLFFDFVCCIHTLEAIIL